jgi:hypothetical protein
LRELSLQNALLLACRLQALVDLDDSFGNLAQFIVGEGHEVLGFKTLIVVGT